MFLCTAHLHCVTQASYRVVAAANVVDDPEDQFY